jgi:hypothetical protein
MTKGVQWELHLHRKATLRRQLHRPLLLLRPPAQHQSQRRQFRQLARLNPIQLLQMIPDNSRVAHLHPKAITRAHLSNRMVRSMRLPHRQGSRQRPLPLCRKDGLHIWTRTRGSIITFIYRRNPPNGSSRKAQRP